VSFGAAESGVDSASLVAAGGSTLVELVFRMLPSLLQAGLFSVVRIYAKETKVTSVHTSLTTLQKSSYSANYKYTASDRDS
jgi:hypothetical protein